LKILTLKTEILVGYQTIHLFFWITNFNKTITTTILKNV